jgi:hypothetical protein
VHGFGNLRLALSFRDRSEVPAEGSYANQNFIYSQSGRFMAIRFDKFYYGLGKATPRHRRSGRRWPQGVCSSLDKRRSAAIMVLVFSSASFTHREFVPELPNSFNVIE